MAQQIQHAFVNKPFYKRFRKCTECRKRIIWTQIAKCKGCKTYRHRRCMQLNNDECCRPNPVESTVQITDPDLETVVPWSNEQDRDSEMVLLPEDDIRELSPAESEVVTDRPENSANVSYSEISKIAERRPYVPDDGNLGADTGPQDEFPEAIKDATATPSDDVMTADECGTVIADEELRTAEPTLTLSDHCEMTAGERGTVVSTEEVQVDEQMPTPFDDVTTAEKCGTALSNEEVHMHPTRDGDAFKLAPYRLPCAETEMDKGRQNDDNGFERSKCSGDEGVQKDVTEEKMSDQPL